MNVSEKNEQAFGLVLDEISKSVLRLLNKSEHELACRVILCENDPTSIFVIGRILVGICDQESDRKIVSGVSEILSASVLSLGESHIKAIVAEVRENYTKQVLALQNAYNDIEEFGMSAEEVIAHCKEIMELEQ